MSRKRSRSGLPLTRSGARYGGNPVRLEFEDDVVDDPVVVDVPEPMSAPALGPLLPSQAEWDSHNRLYDAAYRQGKLWAGYKKKRKRKGKKSTRSKRRSGPGYQVYHPTGDIAGVVGRGGYFSDALSAVGRAARRLVPDGAFSRLGGAGGAVLGGAFGDPGLGNRLGKLAGKSIAEIAGFGAYNVKSNSIMAQMDEGVQIPQFANTAYSTIIKHREYIQDITAVGATAFTNLQFSVNPGLTTTFPWLAGVASNYDQYQILGMIFEFRTLSSDITAGGALGSVILASDYDTVDAGYATKVEMENSEYCTSNKPSVDTIHCIECDPSVTFCPIKYVRSTTVPVGKDPRLYDMCNFQLATTGLPTSGQTVIGELWCSYEIAFYKPNLFNSLDYSNLTDHFKLPTTISTGHYLGADTTTIYSPTNSSNLGGYVINSTYQWPAYVSSGLFLILYTVVGASTALTTNMGTVTKTNCSSVSIWASDTLDYQEVSAAAVSTTQIIMEMVKVTAAGASFYFASGTLPGTISSGDLFVIGLTPALQ